MPAIRDFVFAFESTTTDAGLTLPMCAYEQDDLLVAHVMADTGATTTFSNTPPSGWFVLQSWHNTTPVIAYFKIAGASEGDLVIGASQTTGNETYNGSIVSIRDVNTNYPLWGGVVDSYAETNADAYLALGNGTTTGVGQSFTSVSFGTTATGCFSTFKFYLKKNGSPTGNAVVKLYAHSGTLGTSSIPTGAALLTSTNFDVSTLTTTAQLVEFTLTSANWYLMASATNYVVTIEYSGGDASNYVQVGYDGSSPAHGGNASTYNGTSWTADSAKDVCFYANRFRYSFANISTAAKTLLPTITTQFDNSLLLYFAGSSAASVPSFVEGPVHQILAGDGSAESHGVGWGFMPTKGTSPNTVYSSRISAGASVMGTLAVNPPASGATVIPAYAPTDDSQLIEFIHGVTAFNGNTAIAATADTNFGTTLGSFTANDGTAAAVADTGINSYHSTGGLTNASTAGQVSGAEIVLASGNRFNLGTNNLMVHVNITGANMQKVPHVSSNRGVWVGVRSNTASGGATTGYKIWQVHGVGTPFHHSAIIPAAVNAGAGSTKATSGTLDAAVIAAVGFWVSGIGVLTQQTRFAMVWLMGTTVICGGNSANPVGAPGVAYAAGVSKERLSVVQQGRNQLLCVQMLQFGNGGTDPVYLDLSSSVVEFPRQYNQASGEVYYNSVDNKCGLVFYPGATDTIIPPKVASSLSRFYYGLHASASSSATYDFSGKSVVGAGTVELNKTITIDSFTVDDYVTLNLSSATFQNGTITKVPAANDSLTVNSSTNIDNCTINVSTVTAGNRLCSVADPSIFSGNTFIGGGGHAFRVTSTGTYALANNTFTGFGANESTGAAVYNDSGGAVTLNVTGGGGITVRNGAGASTTVNSDPVTVLATVTTAAGAAVQNANVLVKAASGGPMPFDMTVTVANSGTTATVTHTAHGMATSDKVLIKGASHLANNGVFTITKIDNNSYSYTMGSTPGSNPTGTIKATYVALSGLSNASGQISMSRVFASSQPVTGQARKSTGSPLYKTAPINGTISSTTGASLSAILIADE